MEHICWRCQGPMVEFESLLVHLETGGKCPKLPPLTVHYSSYGSPQRRSWCREPGLTSTKTDEVNCARCTELILAEEEFLASLE